MVEVPVPAAIGEVAVTVDCVADTVPGFTTTAAVCVMATALMVADTVLVSAVVELSVPVATPLALVVPTGCVNVLPVVGVAASTTVAPAIGFPLASFAVTVMVDVPLPAAIEIGRASCRERAEISVVAASLKDKGVIATELIVAD